MDVNQEVEKRVHILDNYYMTADANQFILVKEVTRRQRKTDDTYTQFVTIGYFSTVQALCKQLIKDAIREGVQIGELTSLREIVVQIDALTARLEDAITF